MSLRLRDTAPRGEAQVRSLYCRSSSSLLRDPARCVHRTRSDATYFEDAAKSWTFGEWKRFLLSYKELGSATQVAHEVWLHRFIAAAYAAHLAITTERGLRNLVQPLRAYTKRHVCLLLTHSAAQPKGMINPRTGCMCADEDCSACPLDFILRAHYDELAAQVVTARDVVEKWGGSGAAGVVYEVCAAFYSTCWHFEAAAEALKMLEVHIANPFRPPPVHPYCDILNERVRRTAVCVYVCG